MRQNKNNGINLRKNPYRGIFREIAKSRNTTPQAVHNAWRNNNINIIIEVKRAIKKRKSILEHKDQ